VKRGRAIDIGSILNLLKMNTVYMVASLVLIASTITLILVPSLDYALANLFINIGMYEEKISTLMANGLYTIGRNTHTTSGLVLIFSLIMLSLVPLANDSYKRFAIIASPPLITVALLQIIPSNALMLESIIGMLLIGTSTVPASINIARLKPKRNAKYSLALSTVGFISMIPTLYNTWWITLIAIITMGLAVGILLSIDSTDSGDFMVGFIIGIIIGASMLFLIPKAYLAALITAAVLTLLSLKEPLNTPLFLMSIPLISLYFTPEALTIIDTILSEFTMLSIDAMKRRNLKLLYLLYAAIALIPTIYILITRLIL